MEGCPPLEVHMEAGKLPRFHDPRSAAGGVALLGLLAALLLITASLLLRHDRRSIARVGRRTAYLAITPLFVFVVLPRVLAHAAGDAPRLAAALLRTYGTRVLPAAVALVIIGLAVVVGAIVWPRRALAGTAPAANATPADTARGARSRAAVGTPDQPAITEKLYL